MKMTIYVPDDLASDVKAELGDTNISAICQAALRAELDRARARAKVSAEDFERVEAYDPYRDRDVAFQGHSIGTDPDSGKEAYLTPKGNIALVGEGEASDDNLLFVYVSFRQFASAGHAYDFVSEVAAALGEEAPVMEMDI